MEDDGPTDSITPEFYDIINERTQNSSSSNNDTRRVNSSQQDSDRNKNVYIIMQQLNSSNPNTVNSHVMTFAPAEPSTMSDTSVLMPPPATPDRKSHSEDTGLDSDSENNIGACLICGDRASGYHYSVYSCEGCKGFFKRTVQKSLQYICKDQSMCFINKFSRNSCQFCRFQKCLNMGMRRDAVREDRSPGGKHRHKRPKIEDTQHLATVSSSTSPVVKAVEIKLPMEKSAVDDPLRESLLAAKPHLYPKAENPTDRLENVTVSELMHYGYLELRYIIEWAKKVPGFAELDFSDQIALLKSSFMELNVLRLSFRSMDFENKIKFCEDLILPMNYCESMGWGKELVDGTIEFAQRLKDINLDLTEFCILNGIVLMYPDAHGIEDKIHIAELQSKILDCLRRHIVRQYPQDTKRFGKILLRLPSLRIISAKAAERFLSLTFEGSIQLNDLVLEMMN
ncbi:retinoic acid receptor RXR-alpha-B [Biomphalaria pfeifferi]|uniref:Retinoic acid receptor RXR-alpha-B n=1 Tax=Biomphalaria pfeifferi TaxID=112525 RepID=A0AAD8CC11_BIOPF|nr:retinoic acid receptor RXR-alpha-B [Biomphalaria pfeifferi]